MKITLLSPALGEIIEAIAYYDEQAVGLGAKLDADLEATLRLISEHPAAGSPYERGTRRVLLDRFPFSVIYGNCPTASSSWPSPISGGVQCIGLASRPT